MQWPALVVSGSHVFLLEAQGRGRPGGHPADGNAFTTAQALFGLRMAGAQGAPYLGWGHV